MRARVFAIVISIGAVAVLAGFRQATPGGQTPSSAAGSSGAAALKAIGRFDDVPVGIAVSRDGRIFFAMSRAIDEKEPFSVAEWKSGTLTPFPPGFRQDRGAPDATRLLSVQALTVDARNRLWMLDCGRIDNDDAQPGSAKLVAVDLGSNRAAQTIAFPAAVAGATSFPNDVVVDLKRGSGGVAFLTDASPKGPNGLLVVDLATGTVRRRLNDHPSTRPAPGFIAQVEGQPLVFKRGPTAGQPMRIGADGIALDSDGRHLFYSPLSSRHWYRVDADALADPGRGDEEIARTVEDLGDKGFASDGMLGTADGRVFLTDYEGNAVHVRERDGELRLLVRDSRLLWPDSMALGADGTLYVTATQIERNEALRGQDERIRPFMVWSVKTDSRPLMR